jgi:hypothetical protein
MFTKYDKLVTTEIFPALDIIGHLNEEEIWQYGEDKARKTFENLCIGPWRKAVGKVPLMVSSR